MKRIFIIITALLLLGGCSTMKLNEVGLQLPNFNLNSYFSGNVKGWGMVQDRSGKVLRQFVVDIAGDVDSSGHLTLDESFVWSDGERSTRVWKISPSGGEAFTGVADDVAGKAAGSGYGNTFNWHYHLMVEADGSRWKIKFDDWMFLQPDGVLINRTTMTKFGFLVGEVTIVFVKQQEV